MQVRIFFKKNFPAVAPLYRALKGGLERFCPSLYYGHILKKYEKNSHKTLSQIEKEISAQFRERFGRELDWENPQSYMEKINVTKVYGESPIKTRLADKLLVRDWVKEKIGEEYLVPLLGVYDSFDEIDFDALPEQFVIKCNHDSHSITICEDKTKLNMPFLKRRYDFLLKRNFAYMGYEMHYKEIQTKILVEKYMGDSSNDYKFLCFHNRPCLCYVNFDIKLGNHVGKRNFYDMDWVFKPITFNGVGYDEKALIRPAEFEKMKEIASILCDGFDHVRVDLYLINRHIYFGEMTFTFGNGFDSFSHESDYAIGQLWEFDNTMRKKALAAI